jgi:hypothetical protein
MTEQERLNRLAARFSRLNDAGKAYITSAARQLTSLGAPVKPGAGPSADQDAPCPAGGGSAGSAGDNEVHTAP